GGVTIRGGGIVLEDDDRVGLPGEAVERRGGVLEELGHDASLFERRAQLPCSSVSTADDENAPPHDANSFPFDDEATSFGDDGIHGDVVWRPGCLRDELKIVDDGAAECTREARQDPIVEAASPA